MIVRNCQFNGRYDITLRDCLFTLIKGQLGRLLANPLNHVDHKTVEDGHCGTGDSKGLVVRLSLQDSVDEYSETVDTSSGGRPFAASVGLATFP